MEKMSTRKVHKRKNAIAPNAVAGRRDPSTEMALASIGRESTFVARPGRGLEEAIGTRCVQWHSYCVKAGWSFRLQSKKRNIVYLGPGQGWFLAAFVLGNMAVLSALRSDLPPRVLKMISGAKRYAEGTAVRIEVWSALDVEVVKVLARIKVEN